MNTTSTSAHTHWIHERFEQNFVTASGDLPIASAARQWRVEAVDKVKVKDPVLNCNVCSTRILNFVILKNGANGNRLVVGHDCYAKFVNFLTSGKIECAFPKLDDHVATLRSYSRKALDRTMRGWFFEMLGAGRLPEKIAAIVESLRAIGFAPSTDAADGLVDYYKSTRKFPLEVLIPELKRHHPGFGCRVPYYGEFPYRNMLPARITIDQIDRVKALLERQRVLERYFAETEERKEEAREAVRQEQAAIRRQAWVETQPVIVLDRPSSRGNGWVGRIDGKIAIPVEGKPSTEGLHRYKIKRVMPTYVLIELLS